MFWHRFTKTTAGVSRYLPPGHSECGFPALVSPWWPKDPANLFGMFNIGTAARMPIQTRFGWALDGDVWAFGWKPMGPKSPIHPYPSPSAMGCGWGVGWAFPGDGVVPSSARESANSRGPRERQHVILGRLVRFLFRNLVLKPCDHTIGSRTWGLRARAAVSAMANSSAPGVSTTPKSAVAITFQAPSSMMGDLAPVAGRRVVSTAEVGRYEERGCVGVRASRRLHT